MAEAVIFGNRRCSASSAKRRSKGRHTEAESLYYDRPEIIRREIAQTFPDPTAVDEELRYLVDVLARG